MIQVSGFDFSDNYCGTVGGVKHGKKLILEVMLDRTTAVGGASVFTNAAGSGIFDENGDPVAEFDNPSLSIPVNIQIKKTGLSKGESAIFTVTPVNAECEPILDTPSLKPVRVIITGDNSGNPVIKTLKNLSQDCYWLVTEEGWSWQYEVNDGNPSLSTIDQTLNPFVFTNVKQTTTIKAAESKVTNDLSESSPAATTVNSNE
jgi:hypothetical protein